MKILWIPHTGWHIPQRAHLFCRALSERHEVHVTDWVADFVSPRDYLSWRYARNFIYRQRREGNITIHGVPRVTPALFIPALRHFNARVFSLLVQYLIAKNRIDVVVGTFIVSPPVAPRLIFDLFDDNAGYWQVFGRVPKYAEEIDKTERAYLNTADAVVVVSSVLADKAIAYGSRSPVIHIPNGVDVQKYEKANGELVRSNLGLTGPIVGVIGNNDKLAELNKVLDVAKLLSSENINFIIAGRGHAVPKAQKRVKRERITNVKIIGNIPLSETPALISAFNIGLCPYLKSSGADAGSPMRLLMYSAAGLPTVCTSLEEVRRMKFPNVILIEDSTEDLADGIRYALHLPKKQPPQINKYDLGYLTLRYEAILKGEY